jgi:hypothetical protein
MVSDASMALHADNDITLGTDAAMHFQHGVTEVVTIDSSGVTVEDSAIVMTGTNTVGITSGNTFVVINGIGEPPTLRIDLAGTKLTDSVIGMTATDGISFRGGTIGTTFKDLVTMNAGLSITGGAVSVTSDSNVFSAAAGDSVFQAGSTMKLQHGTAPTCRDAPYAGTEQQCLDSIGTCDQGGHTTRATCEASNTGTGVFTPTVVVAANRNACTKTGDAWTTGVCAGKTEENEANGGTATTCTAASGTWTSGNCNGNPATCTGTPACVYIPGVTAACSDVSYTDQVTHKKRALPT